MENRLAPTHNNNMLKKSAIFASLVELLTCIFFNKILNSVWYLFSLNTTPKTSDCLKKNNVKRANTLFSTITCQLERNVSLKKKHLTQYEKMKQIYKI